MEYALRLYQRRNLPQDPRDLCPSSWAGLLPHGTLRALYFGTEFCEHLLPDAAEALSICQWARGAGLEAVLLTPVMSFRGLETLERLLDSLCQGGEAPSVVFNDWGGLELVHRRYAHLPLRGGRLLNRGLRDPRLTQEPRPAAQCEQERAPRLQTFLQSRGVRALETDVDLEGGYLPRTAELFQRTLHLPYVFAASGRNCVLKAEADTAEGSFTKGLGRSCGARCRSRVLAANREDCPTPLFRGGNTLFYEADSDRVRRALNRCDRIVVHERPMP